MPARTASASSGESEAVSGSGSRTERVRVKARRVALRTCARTPALRDSPRSRRGRRPLRSGRPPRTRHRRGGVTRRRGGPGRPAASSIPCPRPYAHSIPPATLTEESVDNSMSTRKMWTKNVEENVDGCTRWRNGPVWTRGPWGAGTEFRDIGEALFEEDFRTGEQRIPAVVIVVEDIVDEWPVWRNGRPRPQRG